MLHINFKQTAAGDLAFFYNSIERHDWYLQLMPGSSVGTKTDKRAPIQMVGDLNFQLAVEVAHSRFQQLAALDAADMCFHCFLPIPAQERIYKEVSSIGKKLADSARPDAC